MSYQTSQEALWAGPFGSEYIGRNRGQTLLGPKIRMFSQILARTRGVASVFEIGPNVGLNLLAIQSVRPEIELNAIEINGDAYDELRRVIGDHAHHGSIIEFEAAQSFDLVFTSGVLIHINPDHLNSVYDKMHAMSSRYIMVNEYYNPTQVEVNYRGNTKSLFKRDFCGDLLDRFENLELVDYGFTYRRDPIFPQDDCTWFLLRKRESL